MDLAVISWSLFLENWLLDSPKFRVKKCNKKFFKIWRFKNFAEILQY